MGGLTDVAYGRISESLSFDMVRLDVELMQFPQLVLEVNEKVAQAAFERDTAKHEHDLAIAQAQADIRRAGTDSGKKPAEAQVASDAQLVVFVQESETRLILAKLRFSTWQALADAVKTKGYTMKETGDLIVAGFLAPDSITTPPHRQGIDVSRFRRKDV